MRYRISVIIIILAFSLLSLMPKAAFAQQYTSIAFSQGGAYCGSSGISNEFQASGSTQISYSVNQHMSMWVINQAAMNAWLSNIVWGACEPESGGFLQRYILGSDYPLSGTIQLTLPSDSYYIVFVAYNANPVASVVLP